MKVVVAIVVVMITMKGYEMEDKCDEEVYGECHNLVEVRVMKWRMKLN